MVENPYKSASSQGVGAERNNQTGRLGWWALAFAGLIFGLGAWFTRLGIPAVHPGFGGPDPTRIIVFLLIAVLGCFAFGVTVFLRAWYVRSICMGLCAIVPMSFVLTIVAQLLLAVL